MAKKAPSGIKVQAKGKNLQETRREQVAKVTWSYSRRGTLDQCPRRYYYEYFGSAVRKAKAEPQKQMLQQMKKLQNRYQRAGNLLHLAIATFFRRAQTGMPMTENQLVSWVSFLLQRDRAYSASDPKGLTPSQEKYPPVLLREYYYQQPDAEQLFIDTEQRLQNAVHTFANASSFTEFRNHGIQRTALIEQRLRIPGLACKVDGRLDLAYHEYEYVTIIDWKLGYHDGSGDESLQLAAYALWAIDHFKTNSDNIRISKVYLGNEVVENFSLTPSILLEARARIVQDAERMSALDSYGEQGIVEAFTPYAQPAVCNLCPFQQACPEGRTVFYA